MLPHNLKENRHCISLKFLQNNLLSLGICHVKYVHISILLSFSYCSSREVSLWSSFLKVWLLITSRHSFICNIFCQKVSKTSLLDDQASQFFRRLMSLHSLLPFLKKLFASISTNITSLKASSFHLLINVSLTPWPSWNHLL